MNPQLLSKFRHFSPTELDQVPEKPGIYAWYATPQIGVADWSQSGDTEGQDLGSVTFRNVLAKHTARFRPPLLSLKAKSAFRDTWRGKVSSVQFEKNLDAIKSTDMSDAECNDLKFPKRSIENMLASPKQRGRMAELVTSFGAPLLASPLYIGKSVNLKIRIATHFSDLDKWHQVVQRDASHREKMRRSLFDGEEQSRIPDNFACRAIASGFSPDNLEVYVLDIATALAVTKTQAAELAEAMEWFLNTWHRPILGRE